MRFRLDAAVRSLFAGVHGFDAPAKPARMPAPPAPVSPVAQVYHRITAIEGDRWMDEGAGRSEVRFRHDFAKHAAPALYADAKGRGFLYGGHWHVTQHGIEDKPMRHMFGYRHNPDLMGAVRGALVTTAGLAGGVALAAGVSAIPESRLSDTWKDAIVLGVTGAAAILPNAGMGKMFGIAALVGSGAAIGQRRYDWIGMGQRQVATWMAPLWEKVGLGAPTAANAQLGAGATSTPNSQGGLPETVWRNN